VTTAAKWLHLEAGEFYHFTNIGNVPTDRPLTDMVWCKWQVAHFSCPLFPTKESGKQINAQWVTNYVL